MNKRPFKWIAKRDPTEVKRVKSGDGEGDNEEIVVDVSFPTIKLFPSSTKSSSIILSTFGSWFWKKFGAKDTNKRVPQNIGNTAKWMVKT